MENCKKHNIPDCLCVLTDFIKENQILRGQLARMRDALQIALTLQSEILSHARTQKACELVMDSVNETVLKPALSQTQDIAAWHQASLLRAEAKGIEKATSRFELEIKDAMMRGAHDDMKWLEWLRKEIGLEATALRKQADGLEGK